MGLSQETLSFAKSLRLHGEKVHPANPGHAESSIFVSATLNAKFS